MRLRDGGAMHSERMEKLSEDEALDRDRMDAAFMLMDIQEDHTVMVGRKTFAGYTKLQRIVEYLVHTA